MNHKQRMRRLFRAAHEINIAGEGDWFVKYQLRPALDAIEKTIKRMRQEDKKSCKNSK